ncbi:hypothetical protein ACIPMW_00080 [Streptomyces sp. NPDC086669]|uniref:hypothetical protein n=1 Tax=Streptomyces sp. NPDC086669 TaxID=3365753 RepID=UPI00382D5AE4
MKLFWLLAAMLCGGLALAGIQRIAHHTDTATLTGDIAITAALLAGVWICLTHANRITEADRDKARRRGES